MATLTRASQQLFERSPDERFESFQELWEHTQRMKASSDEVWRSPAELAPQSVGGEVTLRASEEPPYRLTDWSFSQLCRMAGVHKETVNRLSPDTACRALRETLPRSGKPMQLLTTGALVSSLHGAAYTRLWNADLLSVVAEYATDFRPPQTGIGGGTGLYCGEQDLFAFLIDPLGWTEIDGEAFAPGFFVWNSEVGRRSLGIQTFWFQAVCQNHIVWDAVEVVDYSRKHTASVHEGLGEVRRLIERLAAKRDERRDAFVSVVRSAMRASLGTDADEAIKAVTSEGVPRGLAQRAVELAQRAGRLTIFSVVDALTRLSQDLRYAGDRCEADAQAATLLALAA